MLVQVGNQFDNDQIQAPLAQGGMGTIYRAVDLTTGQEVVSKSRNATLIRKIADCHDNDVIHRDLKPENVGSGKTISSK